MKMTKCDFCVYGTVCSSSMVEGSQRQYQYVIGSDECKEAARAFTQYMITKERTEGKRKTYNKNINIKKR